MKNIFIVILFFIPCSVFCQDKYTSGNFGSKLQEYYLNPGYEELKKLMLTYNEIAEEKFNKESAQMPIMGFFSVAFSEIKTDSLDLINLIKNNYPDNKLFSKCLKISKHIESILNIEDHNSSINDFYWGGIFCFR